MSVRTPMASTFSPPVAVSMLIGRDSILAELAAAVATPAGRPICLVTGEVGIGRSTVLEATVRGLRERGPHALLVRASPHDRYTRYRLLYRIVNALIGTEQLPPATPQLLDAIVRASAEGPSRTKNYRGASPMP